MCLFPRRVGGVYTLNWVVVYENVPFSQACWGRVYLELGSSI